MKPIRVNATLGAIELTEDLVRVAVIKTGKQRPSVMDLVAEAVVRMPDDEEDDPYVVALRKAVASLETRPTSFVLCVSSRHSVVRLLTVPFKGRGKVAAAVAFELEPHLAIPIEELTLDFLPVREVEGKTEVIAVGIREEVLDRQLAIVDQSGIEIEGVNLDVAGVAALWNATLDSPSGLRVLVSLRESEPVITAIRDGRLAYMRRASISSQKFATDPAAAAREMRNILRALSANGKDDGPAERIAVTGAVLPDDMRGALEQSLGIAVSPLDFHSALDRAQELEFEDELDEITDDHGEVFDRFAPCIGVAFAAAGGTVGFNFLPDATHRGLRRVIPSAVVTCFIGVAALFAYLAYVYFDYRSNRGAADELGAKVWEQLVAVYPDARLAQSRPRGDIGGFRSLEALRDLAQEEFDQTDNLPLSLFTLPNVLDVLSEIGRCIPEGKVRVTNIEVNYVRGMEIKVFGEVQAAGGFAEAQQKLEASDMFTFDRNRLVRRNVQGKEIFEITLTA